MIYLVNAFSLNMLPRGFSGSIEVHPMEDAAVYLQRAIENGGVTPAIGHVDTCRVACGELGLPESFANDAVRVAGTRPTVSLQEGDRLVVAQYRGPRLPEGATSLPEGAEIEYVFVLI